MHKITRGSQIRYLLIALTLLISITSISGVDGDFILNITSDHTNSSCNSSNDGSIAINVTGGDGNYNYHWTGPNGFTATSKDISNLSPGSYTVTVTDESDGENSETIIVAEPDELIIANSTTTPVSCNGGNDGTVTAGTISGGNTTFQYSIDGSNFQSSKTFNDLSAGNYTITVRDEKGCEDTETVTIAEPNELIITGSTTAPVSCNGGTDGSVTAGTISGGNTTFEYSIDGTNFQSSKIFNDLSAGNYTITVRDDKGCQDTETVTVAQPDELIIDNSTTTPVSCNGGNDGTVTAGTITGGNTTFQYSIDGSNFQSSKVFNDLSAGNYTITVRDDKNCEDTETVTVTEPDELIIANSTTTPVSCNGGNDGSVTAGTISGGNTTFQFSIDGSNFQSSKVFNDLSAGNYTITVRDDKNCEDTETVTVTEPDELIIANSTTTPVSCNGGNDGSVTAGTISGGNTTFQFSIDGTNFQSSKVFNDLSAGNYTITVRDDKNCEDTETVTVTEPDELIIANSTTTPVSCNGGNDGSVTAGTITGGNTTFQYSIDGTNFQSSKVFNDLAAGNYTITVRDDKNCEDTETVTVTEPDELIIANSTTTPVSCNGGNDGTVTAGTISGGNITFQYSIDGTNFQSSKTFNDLAAGNYTITVRDDKGCQDTETVTVAQPDELIIANSTTTPVSCNGGNDGTVTAGTISGGNSNFQFSIDGSNFQSSKTFNDLSAGNYTITVRDDKNCEDTETVTVTEPDELIIANSTTTPVSCNGGNDGTVTAGTITGGNSTFQYSIDGSNFQSSKTFNDLSAGNYTITVRDDKNCEDTETVTVTEPDQLNISGTSTSAVSCNGGNDGSINVGTVTGGTSPYLYSLDNANFQSSPAFENLPAAEYTVFIVDDNGCSLQDFIEITEPEQLDADISKTNVNCYGDATGKINLTNVEGGHNNYEFSLDEVTWQGDSEFTGLVAGTYSVFMRDADYPGCSRLLDNEVVITQPSAPLSVTATSNPTTSFGSSTGSATANPTGGTPGYTYEWRLEGNNAVIKTTKTANNLAAGTYEVTVIDAKGCISSITSITVRDALFAEIESATQCEGDNIEDGQIRTGFFRTANLTALGGYGNYEYSWNFADGGPVRTGPGEHSVNYNTPGNKSITLTITDRDNSGNVFQTLTLNYQQYVGLCHEPCGQAQNAQFDVDAIYIGDINGVELDLDDPTVCNPSVNKYLFLPVSKNVNMYNPYTEVTFKTTNGITDFFETQSDTGCKDEDEIDEIPASENQGKVNKVGDFIRLTNEPIEYNCNDALEIEGFYITYTNVSKKDCFSNNKGFCYSINEPVTVPTPVYVEATPTDILCKGESTGIINARGTGGFAPYRFNITGANDVYSSSNTFNNLAAGTYTVYIEDSRGNRNSDSVVIEEPATVITLNIVPDNPDCFGDLGSATATASGGTPLSGNAYEYLWNDPNEQTTATATNLTAGTYTVTVTDANGCQEIESVTIVEPVELTVPDAGEPQSLGCGIFETTLNANTPTEGNGEWSIDTGNSAMGGTIIDTDDPNSGFTGNPGTYTLNWTIANADGSCSQTDTVTIEFAGDCNALDFDGEDDHISMGDNYGFTSGAFTFEIWVKPESTSGLKTIFSKKDKSNPTAGGYDLIINNGSPTFRWGNKSATTSKIINTSRWYHLAVVFQNNTARLYVDGIEVGNTSGTSNPSTTVAPFLMGAIYDSASPWSPKNYFSGWMEEFRIWNKALIPEQIRFMMNQRLDLISSPNSATPIDGELIQHRNTGSYHQDNQNYNLDQNNKRWYDLNWGDLQGYYRLISNDPDPAENLISHDISLKPSAGLTPDLALTKADGKLINIETEQENTAPLPYISNQDGSWRDKSTWLRPDVWNVPNGKGINDNPINWNIVEVNNNIFSTAQDIQVLGLFSKLGELLIDGNVEDESGQGLTVTHYLRLDGSINLEGNSQLIQTEGSILEEASSGYIDIDQQGTANSFNYNYWSSPVSTTGNPNNSGYTIEDILLDGSDPDAPATIDFNNQYHWADGNYTGNARISTYWLYNFGDPEDDFNGEADDYFSWSQFDQTESLPPGIGYTMKGTRGYVPISTRQNYTFRGKPHNGDISVSVGVDQNLLTGNPYPSAIDALQFINENISDFNGALYFWDHFGKEDSHYLEEYVGGYAVYNLSGGISSASSVDSRINNNEDSSQKDPPGQFIPVGQAFFINTKGVDNPITITYKNKYRAFILESEKDNNGNDLSQFHSQEKDNPKADQDKANLDERYKIRLKFESPKGYHRQILVTADENATGGFDLGYDAPLIENNVEDMYWMISDTEFVIQAVPDFEPERVLPLGIKVAEAGEFTIRVDETENLKSSFEIFLKDNSNDEYYKISEEDFTTTIEETGSFNDRFEVVFRNKNSVEETEENESEEPEKENPVQPENPDLEPKDEFLSLDYYKDTDEISLENPDLLNIERVEIYSVSGQRIMSFENIPSEQVVRLRIRQQLSAAVYIVKLFSEDKIITKKIIITK
ncbi:LamG-like jellyroll fold domain-containing protein [Christiangramia sabulilitoris]|uniref:T9SS type A sorting domain-containing protein n=1 Tax=Christiangramia sabulilitoris TaxID=2583991 RepID=A0A550HZ97_9FLAO|nr:LamG-like jellyroll fold domain-containing protein [Christiangramia sabulilitoris]TRO64046.1 T9SS type A sorting domain-containing protein [Christiangramia sabulilitoris]